MDSKSDTHASRRSRCHKPVQFLAFPLFNINCGDSVANITVEWFFVRNMGCTFLTTIKSDNRDIKGGIGLVKDDLRAAIHGEILLSNFLHDRIAQMKSDQPRILISILLINILACRPVMTIGWQEILIVIIILALLLGPTLYRTYRRWDEFQNWKEKRKSKNKE